MATLTYMSSLIGEIGEYKIIIPNDNLLTRRVIMEKYPIITKPYSLWDSWIDDLTDLPVLSFARHMGKSEFLNTYTEGLR